MRKVYQYNDLENTILSCLLQKPELMEQCILEDKHFVKYQRIWKFMKVFYNRYHNFDMNLMFSMTKDKWKLNQYLLQILEAEPLINHFDEYQKQLKYLYEENEKDKWIINKVYEATMELWIRDKTTQEFKNRIDEIYNNADELFKEVNE